MRNATITVRDAFSLTVPANARRSPTMLIGYGSTWRFDLDWGELKERLP
jgi:hypothetical protein